jgi:hypothetical protein
MEFPAEGGPETKGMNNSQSREESIFFLSLRKNSIESAYPVVC